MSRLVQAEYAASSPEMILVQNEPSTAPGLETVVSSKPRKQT